MIVGKAHQTITGELPQAVSPRTIKRVLEIDVLRGFAAVAVVLFHYTTRYSVLFDHPVLSYGIFWGQYGVQLFFVISGFVIISSLERYNPREFVVARLARLFPAYWISVLLTFTLVSTFSLFKEKLSFIELLANLSMVHYFFNVRDVDGVYWSLKYEICFYGVILLFALLHMLQRVERLGVIWVILSVVVLVLENLSGLHLPSRIRVVLLLDYWHLFLAGIVFRNMIVFGMTRERHVIIAICLAVQMVIGDIGAFLAMIVCVALFYLLITKRLVFLCRRPLIFLGTISYSLYLVHQNIGYIIMKFLYSLSWPAPLVIGSVVSLMLLLATVITFVIEKPVIQWSHRHLQYLKNSPS